MRSDWLETAKLEWGSDGAPRSKEFGDIYFSPQDGPGESKYVFIEHNRITESWAGKASFAIGELGFGTGLNFLLTWRTWLDDSNRPSILTYVSVEKNPIAVEDLKRLPQLGPLAEKLILAYPANRKGLHLINLEGGRLRLILAFGEATEVLPEITGTIDAWYLDGFAPAKNPEMWTSTVLAEVARLSRAGTTFATFSAAGQVRRDLENVGFSISRFKGFGAKRESLCGTFNGSKLCPTLSIPRSVAVIGGGLAGIMSAESLARHGLSVTLFEAEKAICQGASGNDFGVVYPYFAPEASARSSFLDEGFEFMLREVSRTELPTWQRTGLLQLPANQKVEKLIEKLTTDPDYLGGTIKLLNPDEASSFAGLKLTDPALFCPAAGILSPRQFGQALLDRCPAIELRTLTRINQIPEEFDAVILAGAYEAASLVPELNLPLRKVRGQLAKLKATDRSKTLKTVLCYENYLLPAINSEHILGASYEFGDERLELVAEVRRELIERLVSWAGDLGFHSEQADSGRVGFRATTPDKLPLVGKLPVERPCYILSGFGSRGLSSIGLAAEVLAAEILGLVAPIEKKLRQLVSATRFTKKNTSTT